MQYLIEASSPIAAALKHALVEVLKIPAGDVVSDAKTGNGVRVNERTYKGLLPMLKALRASATSDEQKAFLGAKENNAPLVNQWVSAASLLSADAVSIAADANYASVAKSIYVDIEKALEMSALKEGFLAGSARATIADVLLYAALNEHPSHAEVLPVALAWSRKVEQDAYLAPIRSAHTRAAAGKGSGAAASATPVYVKPTEEEIVRRRLEKEKAKKEKEAAKAAAGGAAPPPAAPAAAAAAPAAPAKSSAPAEGKPQPGSKKATKESLTATSMDVRVGRLTNVRLHPEADRLYVEDMVLGGETRTIVSGLVEHYKIEELEGSQCLVVCNMKPKALKGITSHGMVLCAKRDTAVWLIRPPEGAQPGDRIQFAETMGELAPIPEELSGNKMTELVSHLHTNEQGVLCWKDLPAHHAKGVVSAPNFPNCPVN